VIETPNFGEASAELFSTAPIVSTVSPVSVATEPSNQPKILDLNIPPAETDAVSSVNANAWSSLGGDSSSAPEANFMATLPPALSPTPNVEEGVGADSLWSDFQSKGLELELKEKAREQLEQERLEQQQKKDAERRAAAEALAKKKLEEQQRRTQAEEEAQLEEKRQLEKEREAARRARETTGTLGLGDQQELMSGFDHGK